MPSTRVLKNFMSIKIVKGKNLNSAQLTDAGRLLYHTDPEIYPTAFGSEINAGKVFPVLFSIKNGLFSLKNLFAATDGNGKVRGVLVGCNGDLWERGTLAAAFVQCKIPLPEGAEDAEENYFAYEAEHEKGDYVLCLCVSPDSRGQGIATSLLKTYLKDKKSVSLECLADNAPALRLYESVGFEITRRFEGYSAPGTPPVPVVKMVYKA